MWDSCLSILQISNIEHAKNLFLDTAYLISINTYNTCSGDFYQIYSFEMCLLDGRNNLIYNNLIINNLIFK